MILETSVNLSRFFIHHFVWNGQVDIEIYPFLISVLQKIWEFQEMGRNISKPNITRQNEIPPSILKSQVEL